LTPTTSSKLAQWDDVRTQVSKKTKCLWIKYTNIRRR
jgi:hypothetical protein